LPQVYPPVRASTPTSLIADPKYQAVAQTSSALTGSGPIAGLPQALGEPANLALTVQERLYTAGPTEILRIVQELDGRTAQLDTDTSKHDCLTSAPVEKRIALPGGQSFTLKLQCMQNWGGGWLAFGFENAQSADAGHVDAHGGSDFYLIEGQDGGMGGAYHIHGGSGDVEAWISVADSRAPNNSQVIMHMLTDMLAGTLELALAGSGVGFCSAHLKTGNDFLFIRAETNGAPPPGTPMNATGQYCDAPRAGCFATNALSTDLGGDAASCTTIATTSFGISVDLETANVMPATIYTYFNAVPTGIPAF
jgi:hypothetical protein